MQFVGTAILYILLNSVNILYYYIKHGYVKITVLKTLRIFEIKKKTNIGIGAGVGVNNIHTCLLSCSPS